MTAFGGPPQPSAARMSPVAIIAVFVGVLLGLALVAGVVVLLNAPAPPPPQCRPGEPCTGPPPSLPPVGQASPAPTTGVAPTPGSSPAATPVPSIPPATGGPTGQPTEQPTGRPTGQPSAAPTTPAPTATPGSDSPPVVSGTQWSDPELGYSFEYDDTVFSLGTSESGLAVLNGIFFDTQIVIRAVPASTSTSQLIADQLGRVDRFLIGRVIDDDPYDALLGPSIGYVRGEGGVFSGTITSQDGTPLAPGGVTILASTDGRLTVAILVLVGTPDVLLGGDTHQNAVRSAADEILKTFDWDTR